MTDKIVDFVFVPELDAKYECSICLTYLKECVISSCGHRFCNDCIISWLSRERRSCPHDNTSLNSENIYPDNFTRREINHLSVKCPNHRHGCDHVILLKDVSQHRDVCQYQIVECVKNCGLLVLRMNMESHLNSNCFKHTVHVASSDVTTYQNPYQQHKHTSDVCALCQSSTSRTDTVTQLADHCPRVFCLFHDVGCREKMCRSQLMQHLQNNVHTHMKLLVDSYRALNGTVTELRHTVTTLGHSSSLPLLLSTCYSTCPSASSTPSVEFRDFVSPTICPAATSSSFSSSSTATLSATDTSAAAVVISDLPASHISTTVSAPDTYTDELHTNTLIRSSLFTTNQLSSIRVSSCKQQQQIEPLPGHTEIDALSNTTKARSVCSLPAEVIRGEPSRPHTRQSGSAQLLQLTATLCDRHTRMEQAIRRQAVQIELLRDQLAALLAGNNCVDPEADSGESEQPWRSILTSLYCNGVYVWRIARFSHKLQHLSSSNNQVLYSNGFYTSPFGYRFCLRVNTAKNAKNIDYMSLFIHLQRGQNDKYLSWPFSGSFQLILLNRNGHAHITETMKSRPSMEAFSRPTDDRHDKGWGFDCFERLDTIFDRCVHNNTLCIKCSVSV